MYQVRSECRVCTKTVPTPIQYGLLQRQILAKKYDKYMAINCGKCCEEPQCESNGGGRNLDGSEM